MIRLGIIFLMLSFAMLVFSPASFADGSDYLNKFTAGLVNLVTGWWEIPKQTMDTYNEDNNIAKAMTGGLAKGIAYAVGRTLAGAVDTAFFFVAPQEGPIMEPLFNVPQSGVKSTSSTTGTKGSTAPKARTSAKTK